MNQRDRELERRSKRDEWNALSNVFTSPISTFIGVEERKRKEELAQAQVQGQLDRERLELYGQLGLPRSVLEELGLTGKTAEDSPPVDVTSYTPAFLGEIGRRAARPDESLQVQLDRGDGTLIDLMQRQEEERLIDPSVAFPRPAPGTYDPTITISSGFPGVPGYEVPVTSAETLAERKGEALIAEAAKAEAERMTERGEDVWRLGVETKPTSTTENVYIEENGKLVPRIIQTEAFFDTGVGKHVTKSEILTGPNGEALTHAIPVKETITYHPDLLDNDDNVIYVNRENPSDRIETGLPSPRIAAARAGVEPPAEELFPTLGPESQDRILNKAIAGAGEGFSGNDTVLDILTDPGATFFEGQAITHLFSRPISSWHEVTGFGERPRRAQQRLKNSQIGLLQALTDAEGIPSERERARVLETLGKLEGGTWQSPASFQTELQEIGEMLASLLRSSLLSLPSGDSSFAGLRQSRWSAIASAAEFFAQSIGLPSILAKVRSREGQDVSALEISNFPDDPGVGK